MRYKRSVIILKEKHCMWFITSEKMAYRSLRLVCHHTEINKSRIRHWKQCLQKHSILRSVFYFIHLLLIVLHLWSVSYNKSITIRLSLHSVKITNWLSFSLLVTTISCTNEKKQLSAAWLKGQKSFFTTTLNALSGFNPHPGYLLCTCIRCFTKVISDYWLRTTSKLSVRTWIWKNSQEHWVTDNS